MQTEQRDLVASIMHNYVKDFSIPEDNVKEQSKSLANYKVLHKARKENYITSLKDVYGTNVHMWQGDKALLGDAVVKCFTQQDRDHWQVRDRHHRDRSKSKVVVDFQVRTKTMQDRVRRILRALAVKIFPSISQLDDTSNREEDADSVLDSNDVDVLEHDNEASLEMKDAEIEKLKRVVINLTGEGEEYKKQIANMSKSDPLKEYFYLAMYNKFKRGLPYNEIEDSDTSYKVQKLTISPNVLSPVLNRPSSKQAEQELDQEQEQEQEQDQEQELDQEQEQEDRYYEHDDLCQDFFGSDN